MDFLWDKITEWLKEMLIGGIVSNLSGMFDATNQRLPRSPVRWLIAAGMERQHFSAWIQNLSETVISPSQAQFSPLS